MLDKLLLNGRVAASFNKIPFEVEFHDHIVKVHLKDIKFVKELKELFLSFTEGKGGKVKMPEWVHFLKEMEIEVYLKGELVAKVGKKAKSDFFAQLFGVDFVEIYPGKLLPNLFDLF